MTYQGTFGRNSHENINPDECSMVVIVNNDRFEKKMRTTMENQGVLNCLNVNVVFFTSSGYFLLFYYHRSCIYLFVLFYLFL